MGKEPLLLGDCNFVACFDYNSPPIAKLSVLESGGISMKDTILFVCVKVLNALL